MVGSLKTLSHVGAEDPGPTVTEADVPAEAAEEEAH